MSAVDPALVAKLDQNIAGANEYLDGLIKLAEEGLDVFADATGPMAGHDAATILFARELRTLPHDRLAVVLAFAVVRLAQRGGEGQ